MWPDLCVLALLSVPVLCLRRPRTRSRRMLAGALYLYLCGVLTLTLLPVIGKLPYVPEHTFSANLRPFRDLLHGWGNSVGQIVLNLLLFLLFGILVPLYTGKGFAFTVISAAACSAAIELLQPFFDRTCDITDLITNTLGCACGYLLYLPLRSPLGRLLERLDK